MLFETLSARYLGPEKYGTYSFLFTVIVIISTLPTLGLLQSTRRFIALFYDQKSHDKVKGVVRFSNYWTFIIGSIFAALAYLAVSISNGAIDTETTSLFILLLLIIPFYAHRKLAISVFSGFKNTSYKVILEDITEPTLRILSISIVMLVGGTLANLVYVTTIAYIVIGIISLTLVRRSLNTAVKKDTETTMPWKVFFGFSATMAVTEGIELALTWLDILMLGLLSTDHQVGLFRATTQPAMLASVILTSFAFIYMPLATELFGRKEFANWSKLNNLISLWSMTLAFPISAVCIAYPEVVIDILFGDKFAGAENTLRILSLAYIFHSACGFTGLNLIIGDKTTTQMKGKVISLLLHIILNLIFIPNYGALGAAFSVLLSLLFSNLYNLYWTNKYFSIHPFEKTYFSLLILNISISVCLYLFLALFHLAGYIELLIMGVMHLPLFALISLKTGIVKKEQFVVIIEWVNSARKSK